MHQNTATPSELSCPVWCSWCRIPLGDTVVWCCQIQQTQTGSSQQSPAAQEYKRLDSLYHLTVRLNC